MQKVAPTQSDEKDESEVGDTYASGRWKNVFPDIETPGEEPAKKQWIPAFLRNMIVVEDVKLEAPAERVGTVEQLSVYTMTVTLMVLAFPVGFAMLIYNILGGENLRATARAMALTGTMMGLYLGGLAPSVGALV